MSSPFQGCPFAPFVGENLSQIERTHRHLFNLSKDKLESLFSVNIDESSRERFPQVRRWDYGIWYTNRSTNRTGHICFVEVHKAEAGEVSVVIEKKRWLEELILGTRLPQKIWVWVPSGKMLIPRNSCYFRRLVQSGIKLLNHVDIP